MRRLDIAVPSFLRVTAESISAPACAGHRFHRGWQLTSHIESRLPHTPNWLVSTSLAGVRALASLISSAYNALVARAAQWCGYAVVWLTPVRTEVGVYFPKSG